ncbi:MAG: fluoride efflux transporter CrcB [Spirochaetaceae bacterium]|jgi:CrcB protein|nr:fluoride efflux transporter CrcB [Spirochaetaceae bacterium]
MIKCILVFLGGGLGALCRFGVTVAVQGLAAAVQRAGAIFPFGTLVVNTAGAFAIGLSFAAFESAFLPAGLRLFVVTGFLGGFTTFSAYSMESARLFLNGSAGNAIVNILCNNALCLVCAALGMWLGQR